MKQTNDHGEPMMRQWTDLPTVWAGWSTKVGPKKNNKGPKAQRPTGTVPGVPDVLSTTVYQ